MRALSSPATEQGRNETVELEHDAVVPARHEATSPVTRPKEERDVDVFTALR